MFCPGCGKPLPPNSHFCPSCGATVAVAAAGPAASAAIADTVASAPAREPKRGFFARMKLWQKVVLGIVVFIFGVIALAMFATSGLDKPVQQHFSALRAGDVVGAYSQLAVATRQQNTLDDFKGLLASNPALTHVTGNSFTSRSTTNGQGHLEGALDLEGGGKLPVEVNLVKENGGWKILSYHVTSAKPKE